MSVKSCLIPSHILKVKETVSPSMVVYCLSLLSYRVDFIYITILCHNYYVFQIVELLTIFVLCINPQQPGDVEMCKMSVPVFFLLIV